MSLETTIQVAARNFAEAILAAVRGSSLQELLALQGETPAPRLGRPPKAKPGPKPGKKPGRPPKAKPGPKPGRKPGRPPKAKPGRKPAVAKKAIAAPIKKKRVVKNYPKCSVPGCGKNRFPRGKGMCGEHYKQSLGK